MSKENDIVMDLDAIVDKYADMVYRLAVSEVKNREDADDIFQEVFIRLVKYIHTLKSEEHVKAWLIRVTINCSKTHFTNYWNKNVGGFSDEQYDRLGHEDSELEKIENEDNKIYAIVQGLPEKYRVIIHLFYYEELSIKEISTILDKKESTIKSQLFRGRELLKAKLKGDF